MYTIAVLFVLFWLLCWAHAIFRMKTGGKYGSSGPGPYCCDPAVTFDGISIMGVSVGTFIIIVILLIIL